MNQLSEKQLSFEGAMMIVNGNKWIKLKDIEKLSDFIQEQQATIEQLKQELEEYKENWDDIVELATKTSLRNVELDEQIGQLKAQLREKEQDEQLYANEILELREANKEFIQFKELGGDY